MSKGKSSGFLSRFTTRTENSADGEVDPRDALTPQELSELPVDEREQALLEIVLDVVDNVLELDGVDDADAARLFTDLGFNSVTAFAFRNQLNDRTGLRLQATLIFDYPTPAELAAHLAVELDESTVRSAEPLFIELDVLEGMFATMPLDTAGHARAVARLEEILAKVTGSALQFDTTAAADLEAASDDEVFEFISTKLGIS